MKHVRKKFCPSFVFTLVACIASLTLSTSTSRAGLTIEAIGDPIPGGSWFHDFHVSSTNSFSNIGLMVNDDYHALKGGTSMDFSSGSTSSWQQFFGASENDTWSYAGATGSSTNDIFWRGHFTDPVNTSFSMSLFAYNDHDGDNYEGVTANWNGLSWSFHDLFNNNDWDQYKSYCHANIVPIPGAVLLGMIGLGSIGVFRRRK